MEVRKDTGIKFMLTFFECHVFVDFIRDHRELMLLTDL